MLLTSVAMYFFAQAKIKLLLKENTIRLKNKFRAQSTRKKNVRNQLLLLSKL
jgi:hypothetical protein